MIQSITKYINKNYNDIIFTESIPKDRYLGMRKIDNEPKLFENLVNILVKNTNIKRREYHYQVVFTIIREVCSFHYYINDYSYEEILEAMRLKWILFLIKGDDNMSILSVNHLSKKINNKIILENISFSLDEGHIVGLVGANGAGKTSLMKVILGYSDYQEGNFTSIRQDENHSNIGALIENPGLYPFMSGYDNLKLLNESNSTNPINQITDELKMNKYIHNKVKTYSLGMKQKLGIAIAFLNSPKLIILDEPMNGLDPKAVRDVRQLILSKAKEGSTFLISSHILSELVKITDSTLIIDKGKIIKEVTRENLEQNEEQDLENVLLDIIDKEE